MKARLTDSVHLSLSNNERTATRKAMTTTAMIIFSTSLSMCKVHSMGFGLKLKLMSHVTTMPMHLTSGSAQATAF